MGKKTWVYTTHHKKCRSNGGTDDESNLVRVPSHLHIAWHLLFKNWEAELIAKFINEVWIDPNFEFIVRRKVIDVTDNC